MPTVKLTARTVDAARPPASGRLELFDEDLPGFCIRVTPNGRRSACIFYRVGPRLRVGALVTGAQPRGEVVAFGRPSAGSADATVPVDAATGPAA
jgi:hypothetical protein